MFKAARNQLVATKALAKDDAPSYFIECLLYNVPDRLFKRKLAPTYVAILDWLETAKLKGFQCQNGRVPLFGAKARTVECRQSAGVRRGDAGTVGCVGLRSRSCSRAASLAQGSGSGRSGPSCSASPWPQRTCKDRTSQVDLTWPRRKKRKPKQREPRTPPLENLLRNGEAALYGQVCWSIANRGTERPRPGEVISLEGEDEAGGHRIENSALPARASRTSNGALE